MLKHKRLQDPEMIETAVREVVEAPIRDRDAVR